MKTMLNAIGSVMPAPAAMSPELTTGANTPATRLRPEAIPTPLPRTAVR
eukprot:CAMPEP_0167808822 /NCGR_PEP_ID=MMETSP0111_2-20121227/23423_1 /TAXON_ID=91324 /ORGANISM="Lotharella globosa, Strain CCCM811" /LENGTH=48 /DNA_ID= /DNA_START= /DNA_END= /DNA_ORIENTATION=